MDTPVKHWSLRIIGIVWGAVSFIVWDVVVVKGINMEGNSIEGQALQLMKTYSYVYVIPNVLTAGVLVFRGQWLLHVLLLKGKTRFIGYVAIGNLLLSFVMVVVCYILVGRVR